MPVWPDITSQQIDVYRVLLTVTGQSPKLTGDLKDKYGNVMLRQMLTIDKLQCSQLARHTIDTLQFSIQQSLHPTPAIPNW